MKKILIVDDEKVVRRSLKMILNIYGYDTIECGSATQAIELLNLADDAPFDLLITDIHMPEMKGTELIHKIRQRDRKIPILAITGNSDKTMLTDLLRDGCNGFLEKPFDKNEILNSIAEIFNIHHQQYIETETLKKELIKTKIELKNDKAELDQLKDTLLNLISHETLTPLTQISGFLQLLQEQKDLTDKTKSHFILPILSSVDYLENFVKVSSLLFSLRMKRTKIHLKNFNLNELIRNSIAEHCNKVKFNSNIPEMQGDSTSNCKAVTHLQADPALLKMAVNILISNAFKFARPQSVVDITLTHKENKGQVKQIVLTISNKGALPHRLAEHIFEPFSIKDIKHHTKGNGLNLALVKEITHAHGGTVNLNTDNGMVTLTLTLPTNQTSHNQAREKS